MLAIDIKEPSPFCPFLSFANVGWCGRQGGNRMVAGSLESPPAFPADWDIRKDAVEGGYILRYSHSRCGHGSTLLYDLLPGVAAAYNKIDACGIALPTWFHTDALFINFCIEGRCEIDYGTAGSVVLTQGTTSASRLPVRSYLFPSGHYIGSELLFNPIAMSGGARDLLDRSIESLSRTPSYSLSRKAVYAFSSNGSLAELLGSLIPQGAAEQLNLVAACDTVEKLLFYFASPSFEDEVRPGYRHVTSAQRRIVQECYEIIAEDLSRRVPAEELASLFDISPTSLKNYFRCIYGKTPSSLANDMRMAKAQELLEKTDMQVSRVAEAVGYANHGKFAQAFRLSTSLSPLEYRRESRL